MKNDGKIGFCGDLACMNWKKVQTLSAASAAQTLRRNRENWFFGGMT